MPVTLSIRNAPDDVVVRLRERAARHHRSLRGELLAILEEAILQEAVRSPRGLTSQQVLAEVNGLLAILQEAAHPPRSLTREEVPAEVERLGLHTTAESAALVGAGRDAL